MKASDNSTKWVKFGAIKNACFMGSKYFLVGYGCHIVIIDVDTEEETYLAVTSYHQNGEGVQILTGHRVYNVFAYSEKCIRSRIFVRIFPGLEVVSILEGGQYQGYNAIVFDRGSFLVTLGELPSYTVTVWNWHKGKKLAFQDNDLNCPKQILLFSETRPRYCAQIGLNTSLVYIWDIFPCAQTFVLKNRPIRLKGVGPITSAAWYQDSLILCDERARLFTVCMKLLVGKLYEPSVSPSKKPLIIHIEDKIILYDGLDSLIQFSKLEGNWVTLKKTHVDHNIFRFIPGKTSTMILTAERKLFWISENCEILDQFWNKPRIFVEIRLIYPLGDFFVARCSNNDLLIFDTESGEIRTKFPLTKIPKVMETNPEYPYLAIGNEDGTMDLYNLYFPENIQKMTSLYLSQRSIDKISFAEYGRIIVAGNAETGEVYIIEGIPGHRFEITTYIEVKSQIADWMLVASKTCYRLFVIPVTSTVVVAGNKIIRYCVIKNEKTTIRSYGLGDHRLFRQIIPLTSMNRDRVFYLVPADSKFIYQTEIKKGDSHGYIISKIPTGHQLKWFTLRQTRHHALTFGCDGLIMVRSNDFKTNIGIALPHHRFSLGVDFAAIDPLERYILSLGKNNIIVCTKLSNQRDSERENNLRELVKSDRFGLLFKRRTTGYRPKDKYRKMCYSEELAARLLDSEEEFCREEKQDIMKELRALQNSLRQKLTENLNGPDNEKIDIMEFNLDLKFFKEKVKINNVERDLLGKYYKKLMAEQDRISSFLIKNYWDSMDVKAKQIQGIFKNIAVSSYPLKMVPTVKQMELKVAIEFRKIEMLCNLQDNFHPWVPLTPEQLRTKLTTRPFYTELEVTPTFLEDDSQESVEENRVAFNGSTTSLYIDPLPYHTNLRQIVTYRQLGVEKVMVYHDILELKKQFNKKFNTLLVQKEREVFVIKQRNERLRHIISEINYFSGRHISFPIRDPEWSQLERPEEILKVTDKELNVRPYVSPSQQEILDAKWAEEERQRLLMMADDFKDRALMKMMNGVLEVRWEDVLRQDVPIPKCMKEKSPSDFNEEDLKAVKEYQEKAAFLQAERERYMNLLEIEFGKISQSKMDIIKKFNTKLGELLEYKLKIETAILQERLKINVVKKSLLQRENLTRLDRETTRDIEKMNGIYEVCSTKLQELQAGIKEGRKQLESLVAKDKLLEKNMKKEIQDYSPTIQDIAQKFYKRRPKLPLKQLTSRTTLSELLKSLSDEEPSKLLIDDGLEYFIQLGQLEQQAELPVTVDEAIFRNITRLRRAKIDQEIRIRRMVLKLNEYEATVAALHKRQVERKEKIALLQKKNQFYKEERRNLDLNKYTQLVMKTGYVEVPLTGCLNDFDEAILVKKKEFEYINRIIQNTGSDKLKTITMKMNFNRKVMNAEWEHMEKRMQINDLMEQKRDIEGVKLTVEMQRYLKAQRLGFSIERTMSVATSTEILTSSFQSVIKDRKNKCKKLKAQIRFINSHNETLDKTINAINLEITLYKMQSKNLNLNEDQKAVTYERMKNIRKKRHLVEKILEDQKQIMELQTELELARLRTYPCFRHKLL